MLNLNPKLKERLTAVLATGIPKFQTNNRKFLNRLSVLHIWEAVEATPKHGKIKDSLEQYIDEYPIIDFVIDRISEILHQTQDYDSSSSPALYELEPFSNPEELAKQLVEELDSLPWSYQISVSLPPSVSSAIRYTGESFSISDRCSLSRIGEAFQNTYPLSTGDEKIDDSIHWKSALSLLKLSSTPTWPSDRNVLQFEVEGFIARGSRNNPIYDYERRLKAIFGALIALRVLKFTSHYGSEDKQLSVYFHQLQPDGSYMLRGAYEMDRDHSYAISGLSRNTTGEDDWTEKRVIAYTEKQLELTGKVIDVKRHEKVTLAAQWLFESHSSRDQLLAFVKAMISLEILLGDKGASDLIGIGELIRNRCAYLIGKSHDERDQIMKEFNELYAIRSKIVHTGKARLNIREQSLLGRLRWMCERVLQEEMRLANSADT